MENFEKNFELPKPFLWEVKDEEGVFCVTENEEGMVELEISNKEGERFLVNNILPEGYQIIGNRKVLQDEIFMGLGNLDGSVADTDNKTIVISEKEIKEEGKKYLLTILHEIGHAARNEQTPQLKEELNSAYSYAFLHEDDTEALKRAHQLIAQDERDAWAFSIREFKKIADKLGISHEGLFESAEELREWIRDDSLGAKADTIRDGKISKLDLSEEKKEQLAEEIYKMYAR